MQIDRGVRRFPTIIQEDYIQHTTSLSHLLSKIYTLFSTINQDNYYGTERVYINPVVKNQFGKESYSWSFSAVFESKNSCRKVC